MPGYIWVSDCSLKRPSAVMTLLMAIIRPPATSAGRIGTKMSAIILMKREKRLPPFSASSLASSLETSRTPWFATILA